ncbi:MAG: hypothetical protein NZ955_05250 [Candidatus Bathyarchaeota archaeon]|nr:hypothetical protein [Candidatus Bathyarchaeota archaeon]MCX8161922.1 hypothetical protein [Candidatus Bathyarchaeota archaeon]
MYGERSVWAEGYPFDASYISSRITCEKGVCPEAERIWFRVVRLPVIHRRVSVDLLGEYIHAMGEGFKESNRLETVLTFIHLCIIRCFNKIFVESTLNRLCIDENIDAGRDSSST